LGTKGEHTVFEAELRIVKRTLVPEMKEALSRVKLRVGKQLES
jgi:hypothetical protein